MKKIILWIGVILGLALIISGITSYYQYHEIKVRQSLSDDSIAQSKKDCEDQHTKADEYVAQIKAKGLRTTDPRTFYSPLQDRCLFTYLVIDPQLPEATTFNSFLIFDLKNNKPVTFTKDKEIKIYTDYLQRISELEKKNDRILGTFFEFWYNEVIYKIIFLKQTLWQK